MFRTTSFEIGLEANPQCPVLKEDQIGALHLHITDELIEFR